jgi:hypothetical protein
VAEVASIVKDRGRAVGVVAALIASAALVSAPAASGADDPIASGTFSVTLSSGFKNQLKHNHVKLTPKVFTIGASSSINPITGAGTIKLGKVRFKKGDKKVVYKNVKAHLPAVGQGAASKGGIRGNDGKLFVLKSGAATVTRVGFGATVSGIKAKLWKGAVKKLNKGLELDSLHKGPAGSLTVSEQPKTVEVLSGTCPAFGQKLDPSNSCMKVDPATPQELAGPKDAVATRLRHHCINATFGVDSILPATRGLGAGDTGVGFYFPATGGTISPAGTDGVVQTAGGIYLHNGRSIGSDFLLPQPDPCPTNTVDPGAVSGESTSWLKQTNLAPNLGLKNLQANAELGGTNAGCWSQPGDPLNPPDCGVLAGDKGIAIAFNIDTSKATVNADPNSHTITYAGAEFRLNALSALVLGQGLSQGGQPLGLFPNASTNTDGSVNTANDFQANDDFGTATIQVRVR